MLRVVDPSVDPSPRRTRALAAALCALAVALLGCRRSRFEEVEVELRDRVPRAAAAGAPRQVFRFGLAAMISPRETASEYATLARELGAELGAAAELVHGKSYREVNDLLAAGQLDAAFLCTGGYLELRSRVAVEVLAVPRVAGRTTYRSFIIAREGAAPRSLLELRGRRFAFTDPLSLTGHLYPSSRLRAAGLEPGTFFAGFEFLGSHDRAIQAVRREIVDAAAVDSLIFDFVRAAGRGEGLRVVERSPELGIPPVVALASRGPELSARWRNALLRLHERGAARAALSRIRIERFVPAPAGLYGGAEAIWRGARR
jgi:phosphonate transport system substrate-binding protein